MQKIVTCLWFAEDTEEAVRFYVSLFEDGEILSEQRLPDGSLMTANFRIAGQTVMALGGRRPETQFTEAASLLVNCADQDEVDRLWTALTADGGAESMCGWCRDRARWKPPLSACRHRRRHSPCWGLRSSAPPAASPASS